jgi:hypothetical protein
MSANRTGLRSKANSKLAKQIEDFRSQHSVKEDTPQETDTENQFNPFIENVRNASKVDGYTEYPDNLKAGHDEAVSLGHVLDALWKHQEKYEAIVNDLTGNAQMSTVDAKDRASDFARYLDSRAKWIESDKRQAGLKRSSL